MKTRRVREKQEWTKMFGKNEWMTDKNESMRAGSLMNEGEIEMRK